MEPRDAEIRLNYDNATFGAKWMTMNVRCSNINLLHSRIHWTNCFT